MTWKPRPSTSLEYVYARITAENPDGSTFDPTNDNVEAAFTPAGRDPVEAEFGPAVWRTVTTGTNPVYQAGALVGVGGDFELEPGEWSMFVRITDAPEVPIIPIPGILSVT